MSVMCLLVKILQLSLIFSLMLIMISPLVTTSHFMMKTFRMKSIRNLFFNEEIISMKIDPHHFNAESDLIESLLNHGSPIISSSSKIDSFFDEFAGELTLLKSISPGINETDCDPEEETCLIKRLLYDNSSPRPPEEFIFENSDAAIESFSPSPIPVEDSDSFMKEIDLSFTLDDPMPLRIKEDDYDSERDILILEKLLSNDSFSLPKNKSFHFDIPSSSRPPAKPPDGNSRILNVKVMGDISEHKVKNIKEKDKTRAKTGQNQTANGKRGKVQSQARQSQSPVKTQKHQVKENTTLGTKLLNPKVVLLQDETKRSLAGNAQNAPPTLKDPKFWTAEEKKTRKIDRLARSLLIQGLPNDIYSLIDSNETTKDLWDALERSKKNTKCISAANEELTAAKHKLMLLMLVKDAAAAVAHAK
nr:hypothetical protein [Tanacetum cinerariifolium]